MLRKSNLKKNITILIGLFMFLIWLLPYINESIAFSYGFVDIFEPWALIFLGIVIFFVLAFVRDNYYFCVLILFIPFIFSHPFDAFTIPIGLFIAIGFVLLGLVIHIIRFRPRFYFGKFFSGLVIFSITCIFGGIGYFKEFYFMQLAFVSFAVVGLVISYVFLSSTTKNSFQDISFLLTILGLFLSAQLLVFYICSLDNLPLTLMVKSASVGWGISNNISIILLITCPFSYYFTLTSKSWKIIFPIIATGIQYLATIASYSRGGILAMTLIIFILSIYGVFYSKKRVLFIAGNIAVACVIILLFTGAYWFYHELFKIVVEDNFSFDLMTIFSRVKIYKDILAKTENNYMFGYGMFQPFYEKNGGGYVWGHNTILHTLFVSGIVGVCGLIYHLIQKYYVLIRNYSLGTFVTLCAFFGSGLYGLIDVSYYFINYMVVLILILALIEWPLRKHKEREVV